MSYLENLDEFIQNIQELDISLIKENDFHLDEKIGSGGTGSAYKGTLSLMNNEPLDIVAKKFSSENYVFGYEGDIYDEAYKELEIMSGLIDNRKFIQLYGFSYVVSGEKLKIYILMERLNSEGDLHDYLHSKNFWEKYEGEYYYSMLDKQKKEICIQMCKCVEDLHNKRIVHCDLKTNNIIYYEEDKRGKLKLIDYGASVVIDGNKITDTVDCDCDQGTEGYMARELKDGIAGYRTDIYSLAVCIIEVWCGDIWLEGEADTFSECRRDVLRSLKHIKDKNLNRILQRCLINDMNKRPPISSIMSVLNNL